MTKYIDFTALGIGKCNPDVFTDKSYANGWNAAIDILANAPAADVVDVARCNDCIYWRGENDLCKGIGIDFGADGYCSEGKRKDGGQDNG